jgi:lysozyme
MQIDRQAVREMLIEDEGLRLRPYRCTQQKLTLGVGRNIDANGIRPSEAMFMLDNDIEEVIKGLDENLTFWREMTPRRQMALINMAFQLGIPGLLKFKNTLQLLRLGAYESAASNMLESLWAKQTPARARRVAAMMREG